MSVHTFVMMRKFPLKVIKVCSSAYGIAHYHAITWSMRLLARHAIAWSTRLLVRHAIAWSTRLLARHAIAWSMRLIASHVVRGVSCDWWCVIRLVAMRLVVCHAIGGVASIDGV